MKWFKKLFFYFYDQPVWRYIFYGGLSTLVNLGVYWVLRRLGVPIVPANIVSVAAAILFAYFVNSRFVFESRSRGFAQRWPEFVKFVSARLSTMVIEVGGVWLLADVIHMNDMLAKFIIQFVVLALNYIFSKFLIFTRK